MSEKKKSSYIFLILRIAVIAGGITFGAIWLSGEGRWENMKEIFGRMNMWVFAGVLGVFVVGHMIVSLRWWLLLRSQSIFIDFWPAVRLYFLGWFYNNFMPSSLGGDLVRAWYVTRHTEKKFEAALSVFVDRIIGLSGTLTIAAFFYVLFMRGQGLVITSKGEGGGIESIAEYKSILLWVVVGIAAVPFVLSLFNKGRGMLIKVWSIAICHGLKIFVKLKDAAIVYCSKPLAILLVFVLTVLMQLMVITSFWFLGKSMGIEADAKYYYVFFSLTWVLGAVPVSIGGAVVIEGMLAYLFVQFAGVEGEAGLALALSQRAVWMITSLPGAFIHLLGAHLPKDFSIDEEQSVT